MLRKTWNSREYRTLAPYAMKSAESRGRRHPEPEADYRLCFQRDRDRVIHCKAFRRLEYKTQVFLNHESDHYRTRLTHTIEVTQISRTIARALGLNEDLTEAIALAHDVGHTPFGHSGEEALNRLMADCGGFEHNAQGLRVVDLLEQQYPAFRGPEPDGRGARVHRQARHPLGLPGRAGGVRRRPARPGRAGRGGGRLHRLRQPRPAGRPGVRHPDHREACARWPSGARRRRPCARQWPALSEEQLGKQSVRYLINLFVTGAIETARAEIERRGHRLPPGRHRAGGERPGLRGRAGRARRTSWRTSSTPPSTATTASCASTNAARRFIEGIFGAYEADPRQLPPQYQRLGRGGRPQAGHLRLRRRHDGPLRAGHLHPALPPVPEALMASLYVQRGPGQGNVFELEGERVWVGRGPDSDITLDDRTVSREHAVFVRRRAGWYLQDLESQNGTLINGQPVVTARAGGRGRGLLRQRGDAVQGRRRRAAARAAAAPGRAGRGGHPGHPPGGDRAGGPGGGAASGASPSATTCA